MFVEMAWNIAKDGEQKVGRYRFVNFSHLMFYFLLLSWKKGLVLCSWNCITFNFFSQESTIWLGYKVSYVTYTFSLKKKTISLVACPI